jgi:outer membrane protein assembly factor BamA
MLHMRSNVVHLVGILLLLAGWPIDAQVPTDSRKPEKPCPVFSDQPDETTTPQIQIAEVTFSGSLQLSTAEQQQIAESIKQRLYDNSVDGIVENAEEMAREGWQDRGYFKVRVSGDARTLTSNAIAQRIAISMDVEEGPQYRFGEIVFKDNKAIADVGFLRGLFPIQRDEIASREKIAKGLVNLKNAYDELGYLNFTPVPIPSFNEENRTLSFEIDIDEGKQFHIGGITALGLDESVRQKLLKEFSAGQTYSERKFRTFLKEHASEFSAYFEPDDPFVTDRHLDERNGIVFIRVDVRPCIHD